MNEKLKKITDKIKNPKFLIIAAFIGIGLIFLSSLVPDFSKKQETAAKEDGVTEAEYKKELENSVKVMVRELSGDPEPTVIITLDSGIRYTYADQKKSETSSSSGKDKSAQSSESVTQSYITVKESDGSEKPLLVSKLMPQVRGVAVICENGNSEQVVESIKNAVTAALNITEKRVYITGGN